ncbi:hypothetical protein [Stakelama saccharophila]|uniref:Uncharacterized protein n=1 Tax=Stakelama saccharophila TaxID=3075605 RepID=A0ABZ0BDG2_9SPHN|nr:hypothetical protein [Stakelama sp. W311]WNO54354.1 hypothetical protein RPR59_03605 [Stakelama sp. W311]
MRHRRAIGFGIIAAALLAVGIADHPSADIRILTHDHGDRAPHRVSAAVDLGVAAFSVLVTWTGSRVAR